MTRLTQSLRYTRSAWQTLGLAILLAAALHAQESDPSGSEARAVSPPSTLSKTLRAFGLETPPGKNGDKAYRKGDYEEALRQYGKAAEESAIPSPLLNRNIGNALYRQKRYPEAADYYERALKGTSAGTDAKSGGKSARAAARDSAFASSTHHNLGNTFYRKAQGADSSAAQEAIADLREAVAHYKKALQLERGNRDAKQNLEMSNSLLQRLLAQQQQQKPPPGKDGEPPEPSARAKEALARALQLTQQRRYPEAAKVLDEIMRTDRTAASFGAHRKRLDDVMKILRGETPADPVSGAGRDPRATPFNPGAPGATSGRRRP